MIRAALLIAAGALALAGCAEREQTAGGIKSDQQVFVGTNKQPPFMAAGWKPGDRAAWEQQVKVRTQGQNDYVKVP
ncbi:MAG: hypothetical protein EOO30_04865 [Comamonadaceae bacterium]|nr:MAG: hypothetical protein EOO30_04865 [Comamonadaceae bacterium]